MFTMISAACSNTRQNTVALNKYIMMGYYLKVTCNNTTVLLNSGFLLDCFWTTGFSAGARAGEGAHCLIKPAPKEAGGGGGGHAGGAEEGEADC